MPQKKHLKPKHMLLEMLVIAVLLLLFASTVAALHETDHRYEVRGYVLDGAEKGLGSVPVTILLEDKVIGSGRSAGDGYYSVRVHLHDSDIGRTLVVRAGEHRAQIKMMATRGDANTERVHHLNFIGGKAIEEKLAGIGIPVWAWVAGAPVLLWGVVYATGATRRHLRRMKKAGSAKSAGGGKGAKRKKSR